MHILLVEDDSITVDVLASKLKDEGHTVYFVGDGLSALTYLAAPSEPKPNLILLDYHLPGMSGDELLDRLQKNVQWHDIPVLITTALCGTDQEAIRNRFPGIRIISKPFQLQELLQEIALIGGGT